MASARLRDRQEGAALQKGFEGRREPDERAAPHRLAQPVDGVRRRDGVEDSAEDGSLGRGLNSGILYLMAIPYVIMAFFAWFVFRKRKEATDVAG